MSFKGLSKYTREDTQKSILIKDILKSQEVSYKCLYSKGEELCEQIAYADEAPSKYCPECGREYPESENFCFECLVSLKDIRKVNVKDIEMNPVFEVVKSHDLNSFDEIFTDENLDKLNNFNFDYAQLSEIKNNIKRIAFKRLDEAIKGSEIFFDNLSILDKITLFTKSFVNLDYKSYGHELGYFEVNRICIDDRQLPAFQITTMLHELAHFLIKEMLTHILCEVLDSRKTSEIESIVIFILSSSPVNQLIDEYCAHTVEGRFTLFGYQDYSSYLNIEKTIDAPADEIEMIKTIGNSFASHIKDILESFIGDDLLGDIKTQFRSDVLDEPNYKNLLLENCMLLNEKGMIQAIRMILVEGFVASMENVDKLNDYRKCLEMKK